MAPVYVGTLLDRVRERTDNIGFSQDSSGNILEGISDNLLIEFLNEGKQFLQSRIISVYPDEFVEEEIVSLVSGTEAYSISDNVFLNNKIVSVEYSSTGNLQDYVSLPPASLMQRNTTSGDPRIYIRRSGQLLFNPIPNTSTAKARVNYYRELDLLDKRRGKISSATSTSITLADDSDLDSPALSDAEYVCIVSKLDTVKDYGVVVSSYNSSTRVITIPTTTLTGTTNDYVVIGKYACSHSTFPDSCHRYLRTYAQLRALHKDSSADEVQEMRIVKEIFNDIIDSYTELSQDVMDVPVLDEGLS